MMNSAAPSFIQNNIFKQMKGEPLAGRDRLTSKNLSPQKYDAKMMRSGVRLDREGRKES